MKAYPVAHMPFGKYKGHSVCMMKTEYLLWVASQRFVAQRHPNIMALILEIIHDRTEDPKALTAELADR